MNKRLAIVFALILLVSMLFGCSTFRPMIETTDQGGTTSPADNGDSGSLPQMPGGNTEWPLEDEGSQTYPSVSSAPIFNFGTGPFLVFDGAPGKRALTPMMYGELYDDGSIPYEELESATLEERIENASGGELFALLSSDFVNATSFEVERRGFSANGEDRDWNLVYIRLYYPEIGNEQEREANEKAYYKDVVTIFANCDGYFVQGGYNMVVVTCRWSDVMQIFSGFGISEEDTTFLDHFE